MGFESTKNNNESTGSNQEHTKDYVEAVRVGAAQPTLEEFKNPEISKAFHEYQGKIRERLSNMETHELKELEGRLRESFKIFKELYESEYEAAREDPTINQKFQEAEKYDRYSRGVLYLMAPATGLALGADLLYSHQTTGDWGLTGIPNAFGFALGGVCIWIKTYADKLQRDADPALAERAAAYRSLEITLGRIQRAVESVAPPSEEKDEAAPDPELKPV